jgi:hypothetical protein
MRKRKRKRGKERKEGKKRKERREEEKEFEMKKFVTGTLFVLAIAKFYLNPATRGNRGNRGKSHSVTEKVAPERLVVLPFSMVAGALNS